MSSTSRPPHLNICQRVWARTRQHRLRVAAVSAAVHLALYAGMGWAGDTRWTAAAGPNQPFWDLASNWSAGPPASTETRALLGSSDTTIRGGSFLARQVIGQGSLALKAGSLELQGPGSVVGHLDLRGGSLRGQAEISAGSLRWSSGGFQSTDPYQIRSSALTVLGAATLSGTLGAGNGARLQLNGDSHWQDGPSSISSAYFTLAIGSGGTFRDEADSGSHRLDLGSLGRLLIEGRYLKTGEKATSVALTYNDVQNLGALEVRGGLLDFHLEHAGFDNAGALTVEHAAMSLWGYQSGFGNWGTVNVLGGGKLNIDPTEGGVYSTGVWNIEQGGQVALTDAARHAAWPGLFPSKFTAGAIRNEGTLSFRGGQYDGDVDHAGVFILGKDVAIRGRGTFESLDGADLQIEQDLHVGRLRIGEPQQDYFSRVAVAGSVMVDQLDWEDGFLDTSGNVTVSGVANLSNDFAYWGSQLSRTQGKEINTTFTFLKRAVWDGDGDLFGTGSIRVASGAHFEDHNSRGTLEYEQGSWVPRPTQVAVASFLNEGRYLKTGAGLTVIRARFDNRGSVHAVGAAPLVFAGPLDNTGTLEAVHSRIAISGPLAQLKDGRLTGGRYVARNGTLVFQQLGGDPGATQPNSIGQNDATIVLDGTDARMATVWLGVEHDALRRLGTNTGRLEVLNGATLMTVVHLSNGGDLYIAGGGTVQAESFSQVRQRDRAPVTWLDGILKARYVTFNEGSIGPGADGETGVANVIGRTYFSEGSRLLLDIQGADDFDRVQVTGAVELKGVAWVDFLAAEPTLGSFRILTATAGIQGRFASLGSSLDPAQYQLTARYTPSYVELTVAAVPEPGTWGLAILGLAVLTAQTGWRERRRPPLFGPHGV